MSQTVRNLAIARIKKQNPTFDEHAILRELMWQLYGFRRDITPGTTRLAV
jgi:hypothetical protein